MASAGCLRCLKSGSWMPISRTQRNPDFVVLAALQIVRLEVVQTDMLDVVDQLNSTLLNEERTLWKLGTLPPGLITFYNLTHPLDRGWHVLGLGYDPALNQTEIENAAVVHYNGNYKPWLDLAITLGGGVIPVSAVLADKDVMLCIQPGEHGSTFGGNPLASAVAIASLQVIQDEKLAERSAEMGEELRRLLRRTQQQFPDIVMEVRGKGLFNAVELISKALFPATAYDLCIKLKERGILAKPTHSATIRLTPPLSMSLEELQEGAKAFHDVLEHDLPKLVKEKPKPTAPKARDPCDRCGRNLYGSS